ncbi:uncharacterized protein [Miscanthus floridulus]|uniref:uncharacterized protein n=1 Tax=Miscanthus floridulus TaxID=154761 RepID=UPI00345943E4
MSDDPMDQDDMAFSDEEESREVIATLAVRRDPATMSAGEEQEAARRAEWPRDARVEHRPSLRVGGLEAHSAARCGERGGQQGGSGEPFPPKGGVPRGGCWYRDSGSDIVGGDPNAGGRGKPCGPSSAGRSGGDEGGELPTVPGGGLHAPSLPSEPKSQKGSMAGTELGHQAASHGNVVVEILSDNKTDTVADPPVSLRELAVVRLEAGPFGGSSEGDLEWPFPKDLSKEIRKVSSRKSHFLRAEHAQMAELDRRVESACHGSQVRATEVAVARAEEQRVVERATAAEQGLEAAKVHQAETKAGSRTSLASTEVALQVALAALEPERAALESAQKALEAERRARSEADREVLTLWDQPVSELVALLVELGEKVKALERDLETTKANFSHNAEELSKSHEECRALEGEPGQIRNAAQLIVSEVFGSTPSTSAPTVQLVEVPNAVKDPR